MSLLETTSTIKQVCIGVNRYQSARGSAMYINCLESYPDEDSDSLGEYQVQHRCSYDDFKVFEGRQPNFFNPMIVTAEGKFEVFAGTKQFTVTKLISVEPYKQVSNKPVNTPSTNKN